MSVLPLTRPSPWDHFGAASPTTSPVDVAESEATCNQGRRTVFPLMLEVPHRSGKTFRIGDGGATGLAGLFAVRRHIREQRFSELTHDLLCVISFDGCFKFVSPSWEDVSGYNLDELQDELCTRFTHPDDAETFADLMNATGSDAPVIFQNRLRCKDGSYRSLTWKASAVAEEQLIYATARDITEQVEVEGQMAQLQLQLIQAGKLDAIGRLAAGVAHEVKNPLAVVLMGIEVLSKQLAGYPGRLGQVLDTMRHAATRAESIVRGLVNLSAPTELKVKSQTLNGVVEQSLLMVRHALMAGHVQLVTKLADALPPVALDAPKIEQVLINASLNGIQSMAAAGAGTLTVKTSVKQLTDLPPGGTAPARTSPLRAGDTVVAVEIEDTGPGVPPEMLARLFDPFFTTKPAGQGTGLGLGISRQIMELHGGAFSIENRPEGGARVTLMLKPDSRVGPPGNSENCGTAVNPVQGLS